MALTVDDTADLNTYKLIVFSLASSIKDFDDNTISPTFLDAGNITKINDVIGFALDGMLAILDPS